MKLITEWVEKLHELTSNSALKSSIFKETRALVSLLSISFNSYNMLESSDSSGIAESREVAEVKSNKSVELFSLKLDLKAK